MPWRKKKSYNLVQSTNKQKKAPVTNGFYTKLILQKKSVHLQAVHQRVQKDRQVHQKSSCSKTMFQNK